MRMFLAIALILIVNCVLTEAVNNELPVYRRLLQKPDVFKLSSSSWPAYTVTPSLRSRIINLNPRVLFEIKFYGQCYMATPLDELYLHIRVNDVLLVGNGVTEDLSTTDKSGGAYMTSSRISGQWFPCSKYDLIHTTAGTYDIEVVAKTSKGAQIDRGVMQIKTTIINAETEKNLNLPLISIRERDRESDW